MKNNDNVIARRELLTGAVALAAGAGVAGSAAAHAATHTAAHAAASHTSIGTRAPFELMALPYAEGALDPLVSPLTVSFHHGKHHKGYVDNLNRLVAGTAHEGKSLQEVVVASSADASQRAIFNNAAQVWNHDFYWNSMAPDGGGKPTGDLLARIERDFGSFETFAADFARVSTAQFGAGWGWLVADAAGKLAVTATSNADLPLLAGQRPLLTVDVWEHAYYLDFQNRRADYVRLWLERLANWRFAAAQLG
jgi:Fe-Mn family superoxide dismutase